MEALVLPFFLPGISVLQKGTREDISKIIMVKTLESFQLGSHNLLKVNHSSYLHPLCVKN